MRRPNKRAVLARVRLSAALERALADDVAKWVARVGRLAAERLLGGEYHAASEAPNALAHALERRLFVRLEGGALASARLTGEGFKASPIETRDYATDASTAIRKWLRRYTVEKVQKITETLRKLLRRLILPAERGTEPPVKIAKRIVEGTSGQIGKARAMRIARTEMHVATERGAYEAASVVGSDIIKRWMATEDSRTRPWHAEADGQEAEMNGYFIVYGERMLHCGDPNASPANIINCRCATGYFPKGY